MTAGVTAAAATKVDASWAATNASVSVPMPMAKHAGLPPRCGDMIEVVVAGGGDVTTDHQSDSPQVRMLEWGAWRSSRYTMTAPYV